jgi:uncharacterized protein YdeI (YjbR/CyaY-like superfamily)
VLEGLPPSRERGYLEFIEEARRVETRAKRITETIARLRERPGEARPYR